MNTVPYPLAIVIACLIILSAFISCLVGTGYCLSRDFFRRLHLTSFLISGGMGTLGLACGLYFGFAQFYLFFKIIIFYLFILFSAPASSMLLASMGLYRSFEEKTIHPALKAKNSSRKLKSKDRLR